MKLSLVTAALLVTVIAAPSWASEQGAGFKKIKQQGSLVSYSGTVTLEGEFWYPIGSGDQEIIGNQLCFNVTDQDSKLIPRDKDDTRSAWFCFKDTQQAAEQLGVSEFADMEVCEVKGKVSVEVTNYVVDKEQTDTNDVAELLKVVKKPETVTVKLLNEGGTPCESE
ncbi:MAG: hypothetical protein WBP46_15235 [Thiolinea sp.]